MTYLKPLVAVAVSCLSVVTNAADRVVDHFLAAASSGCLHCHANIELICEPESQMMQQIIETGTAVGDPAGCIVCHNGDATETIDKAIAVVTKDNWPST